MRPTIDIDDRLMRQAMKAGRFRTKRETIEAALKALVHQARARKLLDVLHTAKWEGDLDAWRRD